MVYINNTYVEQKFKDEVNNILKYFEFEIDSRYKGETYNLFRKLLKQKTYLAIKFGNKDYVHKVKNYLIKVGKKEMNQFDLLNEKEEIVKLGQLESKLINMKLKEFITISY